MTERAIMAPPALVSPRGALRRSLVLWGWGQVATGDRRGFLLAVIEILVLGVFVVAVPALLEGTLSVLLYLGGVVFVAAWAAVALHAYTRAAGRRAPYVAAMAGVAGPASANPRGAPGSNATTVSGLAAEQPPGDSPAGDGGAVDLLWLAPVLIITTSAFWALGGTLGSPESTLATYVRDWRANAVGEAAALFVSRPGQDDLSGAWSRQGARLHNELVPIAAAGGEASGVDPNDPLDSLRFVFDEAADHAAGTRVAHVQTVRRSTVRDTFFGLVPTTTQRLVTIADVGVVRLVYVPASNAPGGAWRIGSVDLLDEHAGT